MIRMRTSLLAGEAEPRDDVATDAVLADRELPWRGMNPSQAEQ
jgi:hypothetical protein